MRQRLGTLGLVAALAALPLAGPAQADGKSCVGDRTHGKTCGAVFGKRLDVGDVVLTFHSPSPTYLAGDWAAEMTEYACDPRGKTKQQCAPDVIRYGVEHHGNPPKNGTTCKKANDKPEVCEDTFVGSAYATRGDFSGYSVLRTYPKSLWICLELATRTNGVWRDNGDAGTKGLRSCQHVH